MTKLQWLVIILGVVLFCVLYFGLDTKSSKIKAVEKSRLLTTETTSVQNLLQEAKAKLAPEQAGIVLAIEQRLEQATQDSLKVAMFKELSGAWYKLKYPEIAGFYAEEVASLEDTEESWSIAGTTYALCVQQTKDEKVKSYCTQRAIQAFESASSINAANTQHKVNLALVYVENPPSENPMKGVQMLLDLNKTYPEDILVLLTLARQGIRTGQFDKATERLKKVLSIDANNRDAFCLLSQILEQQGKQAEAASYSEKCKNLSKQ